MTRCQIVAMWAGAWLALVAAGCGGEGPGRYQVSGTVTYGGQPVAGGRILFVPDEAKGNVGPGSVAEIRNGRYATRAGKGVVGGPHRVTIFGTDGSVLTEAHDNALFAPFETTVDLPKADSQHDFEVPASGASSSADRRESAIRRFARRIMRNGTSRSDFSCDGRPIVSKMNRELIMSVQTSGAGGRS